MNVIAHTKNAIIHTKNAIIHINEGIGRDTNRGVRKKEVEVFGAPEVPPAETETTRREEKTKTTILILTVHLRPLATVAVRNYRTTSLAVILPSVSQVLDGSVRRFAHR